MNVFSRWTRSATVLAVPTSAIAIALAAVPATAGAAAITNPAQNPYPVTVTIDGQTYHDGEDTLPGYDDYLCTPIPDVQYDFADNEILYYDDDGDLLATAPWTEWSRISSYNTWLEQQQAAAGSGSSGSGSGSSGSGSSGSGSSGSGSSGSGSSGAGSSGSGSSGSGSSGSGSSGSGSSGAGSSGSGSSGSGSSGSGSSGSGSSGSGSSSSGSSSSSSSSSGSSSPSSSSSAGSAAPVSSSSSGSSKSTTTVSTKVNRVPVEGVSGAVAKAPTSKKGGKYKVRVLAGKGKATATGTVTVKVRKGSETKDITGKLSHGVVTFSVPKLARGTWNVAISWTGDTHYLGHVAVGGPIKVSV